MAVAAGALFLSGPASAQQPAKPAPATKAKDSKKTTNSAWVKLCEKQKLKKGGKKVSVCLTHHERYHPTTGQTIILTGVRQVKGEERPWIVIQVPLGRRLPPGLVLNVDEGKKIKLQYAFCLAVGCVAEAPLTDDLLSQLKKGTSLFIGTIELTSRRIGFKIPLTGFTRTYEGPPIDNKLYVAAQRQRLKESRARQIELVKRVKAAREKKKADNKGGAAPAQAPKKAP